MRFTGFITTALYAVLVVSTVPLLSACQPAAHTHTSEQTSQLTLDVFLVRHAEKTKAADEPALTAAGQDRAQLLSDMLKDAGITHIHSSDYKRTRDTAAPLAARLGLTVQIYNPRDLPAMAEQLKQAGGRHLVVGHSNTTPQLTELLGGDGGTPIVEANEYDRLYLVNIASDGAATSTLLRFGEDGS